MARASLRGGAIRKEMLPHCVQPPGAWPPPRAVPIRSGRFALAHQIPSAARRAANPESIGIPHVNRGETPRLALHNQSSARSVLRAQIVRRAPQWS